MCFQRAKEIAYAFNNITSLPIIERAKIDALAKSDLFNLNISFTSITEKHINETTYIQTYQKAIISIP